LRREQLYAKHQRREASEEEEGCQRDQIQNCDALVICGEEPRPERHLLQIAALGRIRRSIGDTHCCSPSAGSMISASSGHPSRMERMNSMSALISSSVISP